jgi:hypothetical protein
MHVHGHACGRRRWEGPLGQLAQPLLPPRVARPTRSHADTHTHPLAPPPTPMQLFVDTDHEAVVDKIQALNLRDTPTLARDGNDRWLHQPWQSHG